MDATRSFSFEVGSATGDANTIGFEIKSMKAAELNIQPIDIGVDTMENSLAAIANLDSAIAKVNTQRSNLGATSNRLSYTISNLSNISTNLLTAKGTIEDADYALETTNLARAQILKQASTAMLAQANADQESILSLLRG
jgi:flagellin